MRQFPLSFYLLPALFGRRFFCLSSVLPLFWLALKLSLLGGFCYLAQACFGSPHSSLLDDLTALDWFACGHLSFLLSPHSFIGAVGLPSSLSVD